jgi:NAD(P)H-dependent flavin oxidoreductase YrpB (nitropropane dioxygenase family)
MGDADSRSTPFTDLVGCRLPLQMAVLGGGMGSVELAGAVSNAGGLGMLPQWAPVPGEQRLARLRSLTAAPSAAPASVSRGPDHRGRIARLPCCCASQAGAVAGRGEVGEGQVEAGGPERVFNGSTLQSAAIQAHPRCRKR